MTNNRLFSHGIWGQRTDAAEATVEVISKDSVSGTVSHKGGLPVPFVAVNEGASFYACGFRFYYKDWKQNG